MHCSVKNAAVLCENHRERVTQIWTSLSEEEEEDEGEEEEKHFGRLVTFWFNAFVMLFSTTGCVFRHENIRRWTVGCYNGLYVSCFGDFEKFVCISIYCVSALSLRIESTESMTNVTSHNLCNKNKINCSPDYMKQGSHDLCVYKVQSIQLSNKTFSCSLMLETYMMQRFIVV